MSNMSNMKTIITPTPEDLDPRRQAMHLYWQGFRIARIAEILGEKAQTIYSWKRRDEWEKISPLDQMQITTASRYTQLILKDPKEPIDFKEIDLLARQLERQAKIGKYAETGRESDLDPSIIERASKGGKAAASAPKNVFSESQVEKLKEIFFSQLFDYQKGWYDAGDNRIRNFLKSRQIGATFYFAREALIDALTTGRNQAFVSASKAQAHVFKTYIQAFAREVDVELKGSPIILPNNAELHFLGTNAKTAQGRPANLYFDEYFWIHDFMNLRRAASGMASQKKYRQTYFSTPSSIAHPAYEFWKGTAYNKGKARKNWVDIDVSHQSLKNGRLCEDSQYRQIVNIEDALRGGCDLFDLDYLRRENSDEDFDNLFMCNFIDDAASVFPFEWMFACMVDSWTVWKDFKPFDIRPFGNRPVWVGYDPADSGDSAGLVVIAPPTLPGGKFRIIERLQFRGNNFKEQAEKIQTITNTYNVEYLAIDHTGLGRAVGQLVQEFYPAVTLLNYSLEQKRDLVLKSIDIIKGRRLEFDTGLQDVAKSFMSIKKTMTASGNHYTYTTSRTDDTGHGDIAWATMMAMFNEPWAGIEQNNSSIMEIC